MAAATNSSALTPRPLLDGIGRPADVRKLAPEQLPALAAEVRAELLEVIGRNGGHLASNLGIVELTIALLYVFSLPPDQIVWDTGHQGYVYKLLTGRRRLFQRLRQDDGCCGFLHREESPYDIFGAGHAGTAISAATGLAVARDRLAEDRRVVAVVGDGAIGCGVSLEGLNNIIEATQDLIVVLNDNKMSIAPNVGAVARCLNRVIAGERYNRLKALIAGAVSRIPMIGGRLRRGIRRVEEAAKGVLMPGLFFEELGLRYIGPLNAHDLDELIDTFHKVRKLRQPLIVHVLSEKGRGYAAAEAAPERFHGMSAGAPKAACQGAGDEPEPAGSSTFSRALGASLEDIMARDARVVAVTASMCEGTGLGCIRTRFPNRFFDVGIAEEHAVVFAGGMAVSGLRPVVAIYATFMQRAMDYVFHDICLQGLPVVFCLDRAGVVADGPTHHGILDLAFWRALPNLAVLQPADAGELCDMLDCLLRHDGPGLLRYPKGQADALLCKPQQPLQWGRAEVLRDGDDVAVWGVGREANTALLVAEELAGHGIQATVVNPRFIVPFDRELLMTQAARMPVVVIEDHAVAGGFAAIAAEALAGTAGARLLPCGWPREVIPWGTTAGIRRRHGLGIDQIADRISRFIQGS